MAGGTLLSFLFLLICSLFLPTICVTNSITWVSPNHKTLIELIPGDEVLLSLGQLAPSTTYELKVSYSGAAPIDAHLTFQVPSVDRKLLDTEKLIFSTDENGFIVHRGNIIDSAKSFVLLKAVYNGVSRYSKDITHAPIKMHILLDPFLPVINVPSIVIPLVGMIFLGIMISVYFLYPAIINFLVQNHHSSID